MTTIKTIQDVVDYQLCSGCGVCAFLAPERFAMRDHSEFGRRPDVINHQMAESRECLAACPGAALAHGEQPAGTETELWDAWGPVRGVWEGHAADQELRAAGSSGGAASALALYCIEREKVDGVLHTGSRRDAPYLNETVVSRSREDLLARTGSRYAPASPCDGLAVAERDGERVIFIGKPCDVAAVRNARSSRPALDENVALTIGFFCAGTPSTRGTLDLLATLGVTEPESVSELRYRGRGWPGMWTARTRTDAAPVQLTYAESWGYLQRYRQWRCYICPDHTGEFADIAVGDPWYRQGTADEPGRSLIVARTQRGVDVLNAAVEAGYLVLGGEDITMLPRSQPNLLGTRSALWGRLAALRVLGAAVPDYSGFSLFRLWWHLPVKEKVHSIVGTVSRVFRKRLRHRLASAGVESTGRAK